MNEFPLLAVLTPEKKFTELVTEKESAFKMVESECEKLSSVGPSRVLSLTILFLEASSTDGTPASIRKLHIDTSDG